MAKADRSQEDDTSQVEAAADPGASQETPPEGTVEEADTEALTEVAEETAEHAPEAVEETAEPSAIAEEDVDAIAEPVDEPASPETVETAAEDVAPEEVAGDTPDEHPAEPEAEPDPEPLPDPDIEVAAEPEPASAEPEPVVESPAPAATETVIKETVVQRKGGFLPMLLGGVLAAGVGFGAAQYPDGWPFAAPQDDTFRGDMTAQLEAQARDIAALRAALSDADAARADLSAAMVEGDSGAAAQIDALSSDIAAAQAAAADRSAALEAQIGGAATSVAALADQFAALSGRTDAAETQATALSDRVAELQTRLAALERRPVEETVSPEAIAAYEREIERLREEVMEQRAEVENLAQEAVAAEQSASALASAAAANAALTEVLTALQNGTGFEAQLQGLADAGIMVPAALSAAAADGVPTQAALMEAFPEAAREALSAARIAEAETETDRSLTSILRRQLGVRSLTPQEGMSTDAILSRAEDALRRGDTETALAELDSLSPPADAAVAGLRALIATRHNAFAAATAVGQDLN